MNIFKSIIVLSLFMCIIAKSTWAASITYNTVFISGNTWEYIYTVENNSPSIDIEEFTVFFDVGLYENITPTSTPVDWDPLAIEPDPFLPDDGFYDALALVSGINPGDILGGFSVQFDFLGAGTPGSQLFDIVNPNNFSVLETGTTSPLVAISIPEPSVLLLFASGLTFLGFCKKKLYTKISIQ